MDEREKDENSEPINQSEMIDWRCLFPTRRMPADSRDSRLQGIRKKEPGNGEATEHMIATYWG